MPQTCMLRDRVSGDLAGDEVSDWIPAMALKLPLCVVGPPICVVEQLLKQRGPGLRLRPPPPVLPVPLGATLPVEAARQPLGAVADEALALVLLFVISRLTNEGLLESIRCCNFSSDRSSSPPSSFGGMTLGVAFECCSEPGTTAEPRVPIGGVEPQVVVSVIVDVFTTADDRARANASPAAFTSTRSPLPALRCLGKPGVVGDQARWRCHCASGTGDAETGRSCCAGDGCLGTALSPGPFEDGAALETARGWGLPGHVATCCVDRDLAPGDAILIVPVRGLADTVLVTRFARGECCRCCCCRGCVNMREPLVCSSVPPGP